MSSDNYSVIDMRGNITGECSSDPEEDTTQTRRYNLLRTIKRPSRYGDVNSNKVYKRDTNTRSSKDFDNCTVEYNETNNSYIIHGFQYGTEYFTSRGAEYIINTPDTLDGFTISRYGKGFLLFPPYDTHSSCGTKYFHEAWWMPSKHAWFFRSQFYDNMLELGATVE